ncbi:hypothetical protein ACH427_13095 [Streptomyces sp. NPDC020379]|uniref:hypothetical protein n=1 Tax=Streptomyces sp. NPDC020379 TaxID=3365071 RepID=UPI003788F8C1
MELCGKGAGVRLSRAVHLLIDRDAGTVDMHANPDPERGYYGDTHRAPFGEEVTLPGPVNITLDTGILKNDAR